MKKIVLTLALAAFAFAANAQFVIGGQIGFNTDGGNTWNRYAAAGTTPTEYIIPHDSYTDFVFAPKFGYNLNEKMHVGITLGFTSEVHKDYSSNYAVLYRTYKDFEGWDKTTSNGFYFAPYFRYTFMSYNKLSFFAEAQLAYRMTPKSKVHSYNTAVAGVIDAHNTTVEGKTTTNTLTIAAVPGVNYRFSNHFSADLYIDLLGISFVNRTTHYKDITGGAEAERKTTSRDFNCIATFNAESLANHLNLFRLGFNYHF